MEVETDLLEAIDQLASDGSEGEIRCLAALLASRGKAERRTKGWQHPFGDFVEREGAAAQEQIQGLIRRRIVVVTRKALELNSVLISRDKDFVTTRCANRLFTRAHAKFAGVLREIPFEVLHDLTRNASTTAENRAHRSLGRRYWELKRAGLLASSNRTKPYLFPSLHWVQQVPWAAAVALTLEQGDALTYGNLTNDCGMAAQMAIATGSIERHQGTVQLTAQGRELAHTYITKSAARFRWIAGCRDEAMRFLLDQVEAPLPAFWVDGTPTAVDKAWLVEPDLPLRLLLKDRRLRSWLRRIVRRLAKLGLAQLISRRDGTSWYYFAPGLAGLAKAAVELPPGEPLALPPDLQAQCVAANQLLSIAREPDGFWRLRLPASDTTGVAERTLARLKVGRLAAGPAEDGAYRIPDPADYRWAVKERLLDPAAEFLTTPPEEEEAAVTQIPLDR